MAFRSMLPSKRDPSQSASAVDERDPFLSLHRQVNRAFDDMLRGVEKWPGRLESAALAPNLDISERKKAFDISVELPGVEEDDIHLELSDQGLVIRGEKKLERDEEDEEKGYHVMERSYGSFLRTIPLGFTPDPDEIEAVFKKGILKITVPKPAEEVAKSKRIGIKAG